MAPDVTVLFPGGRSMSDVPRENVAAHNNPDQNLPFANRILTRDITTMAAMIRIDLSARLCFAIWDRGLGFVIALNVLI